MKRVSAYFCTHDLVMQLTARVRKVPLRKNSASEADAYLGTQVLHTLYETDWLSTGKDSQISAGAMLESTTGASH